MTINLHKVGRSTITSSGKEYERVYRVFDEDVDGALSEMEEAGFKYGAYNHPVDSSVFVSEVDVTPEGPDTSLAKVRWSSPEKSNSENEYGEVWEWRIESSTTHISSVSSPEKQTHYGEDIGQAIGVEGSDVKGVDVYRPAMSLNVTKRIDAANLHAWRVLIQSHLNTVNDGNWKSYKPGEVLFLGGDITKESEKYRVELSFLISRQQESEEIEFSDGTRVTIEVAPWDYLHFQEETKQVGGKPVWCIKSAHIAQVYERSNFNNFNLRGMS